MDAIGSERLANNLSKTKHTLSRRCDILEAVGERERERKLMASTQKAHCRYRGDGTEIVGRGGGKVALL